MIRILALISLILTTNALHADSLSPLDLVPCFNMDAGKRIAKEVNALLSDEFCDGKVDYNKFAARSHYILEGIMTKSFLEVIPPAGWQDFTDELIEQCVVNKNLCQKQAQQELVICFESRIPLILLQFGPWVSEHCPELNKSLIQQWSIKKTMLQQIVQDSRRI